MADHFLSDVPPDNIALALSHLKRLPPSLRNWIGHCWEVQQALGIKVATPIVVQPGRVEIVLEDVPENVVEGVYRALVAVTPIAVELIISSTLQKVEPRTTGAVRTRWERLLQDDPCSGIG